MEMVTLRQFFIGSKTSGASDPQKSMDNLPVTHNARQPADRGNRAAMGLALRYTRLPPSAQLPLGSCAGQL
jgi:hypothetical protein